MAKTKAKAAKPQAVPAELVRKLLRGADRAALATSLSAAAYQAWPYASLVLVATAEDGSPILFISDLSEHAKNIAADNRVSLLIDGTTGLKDPLTGPRVSILARAVRADLPELKARFLARNPGAKIYAGFADFHVYRLEVTRAHFVAGFGRIHWIEAAEIIGDNYGYEAAPEKKAKAKAAASRKPTKAPAAKGKPGKAARGQKPAPRKPDRRRG
ncbi:MAG TPA: pyridoxamine 5'-phosphate oxidase family protein [Verrucomicrobiae bacterium]|nr:pyridoxamine 5'-phosphate oxidase family protein [Verrucomicrobiae bacterium]